VSVEPGRFARQVDATNARESSSKGTTWRVMLEREKVLWFLLRRGVKREIFLSWFVRPLR
jgi:hypothetical protein